MNGIDPHAKSTQALFERAVQGLDLATANRLRLARRVALAGDARPRALPLAWPGAAAAALVLALGLGWWLPSRQTVAPPPTAGVSAGDAALVVEDGEEEIYAWLAEAPVAADPEPEQAL